MGNTVVIDTKRGKIIRVRPLHYDEKQSWESLNPWTIEARGKSFTVPRKTFSSPMLMTFKNSVNSPNNILYPLKRVDWSPENPNTQNRGKSKFKKITWDEATDIIASEIKRIQDKYGPYAILCQMDGHGESKNNAIRHGGASIMLDYTGGWTQLARNPDSWEGWVWGAKHTWGQERVGKMVNHINVWTEALRNTELTVHWGDGETTPLTRTIPMASQLMYWCDQVGIETVYVDPGLNYAASVHGPNHHAKWIPTLPNTDAALFLALSYVWITEGTYDEDFVRDTNYCIGFDKWEAYVLGDEDGIPKTPAWASERTGIPEYTIKALARRWASRITSTAGSNYGSGFRGLFSSEPASMLVHSLAMQGLGTPGVYQLTYIEVGAQGLPGCHSVGTQQAPGFYYGYSVNAAKARSSAPTPLQFFPKPLYSQALLDHDTSNPLAFNCKDHCTREEQFVLWYYPAEGGAEIHAIVMDSPCNTVCLQWGQRLTKAFRDSKIEFIWGNHMKLEDDCYYCDVLLPEVNKFETHDFNIDDMSGMFNILLWENTPTAPKGERKTNLECNAEICKKLEEYGGVYEGLYNKFMVNMTYDEMLEVNYDGLRDEIKAQCSLDYLKENQYFVIPCAPDWEDSGFGGFSAYRADPEENPLETQTGKIEFERQDIKEHLPDDRERPPVPHWITGGPGWTHDESLWGERCKDYPMLMVANHPRWREHAQNDDHAWLREIRTCKIKGPDGYLYETVWMNPVDAAARGISTGDIVKIYNDRGTILGGALVWERIIPGAIWQDHGARIDEISRGEIERTGSNNMICPLWGVSQYCLGGEATSGYLIEVEKLSLDEMEQWKKDYPDAFARRYDPAYGLCADAWIVDE